MPFSSVENFVTLLRRLQLVDDAALRDAQRTLGSQLSIERLIKELEARGSLTSYQSGRLLKQETDGLRLGKYRLLYRNASGSFARVFRGCSVEDKEIVAIKLLRQRYAEDPRSVNLFRREGELGRRLKHKNIVPIYEVASEGNQHYFTMEFVEGGNFRDFIKIRKKFSVAEATKYALDIAEGLEYALGLGLTHRDLKLSNVLLSAQGVAKLVDFGLAGQDQSLASLEEEVDRAIEYATLEKHTHAPDNDPRSDLYFLGGIYYELLSGQPPYAPTRSRDERRQFSRYRDIRPIRQVAPELPPAVTAVVDRLMAIEPYERYQSPAEVVAALQNLTAQLTAGRSATAEATTAVDGGSMAEATAPGSGTLPSSESARPTIICVEHRPKQQDALREYFTKHGYRVLLMADPVRALNRVEPSKAVALVLMGDTLGKDLADIFQAATIRCRKSRTAIALTLSKKSADLAAALVETPHAKILRDGVTLRDIRKALQAAMPDDA